MYKIYLCLWVNKKHVLMFSTATILPLRNLSIAVIFFSSHLRIIAQIWHGSWNKREKEVTERESFEKIKTYFNQVGEWNLFDCRLRSGRTIFIPLRGNERKAISLSWLYTYLLLRHTSIAKRAPAGTNIYHSLAVVCKEVAEAATAATAVQSPSAK